MNKKMTRALDGMLNPSGDGETIVRVNGTLASHGWVKPRADGFKATCGGPETCAHCRAEIAEQPKFDPLDDLGLNTEEIKTVNDFLDKPIFDEETQPEGDETIAEWKNKLVLANTVQRRAEDVKKLLGGELAARIKHYRKLSAALADAIRFKSTLELERAFGTEWEEVLADLKPMDGVVESMRGGLNV